MSPQPAVLVRIDDRLIHGQVVEGWIPYLRARFVIVVSDAAACDSTQMTLMRLALPENVDLEVLPVSQAAGHPTLLGRGEKPRPTLVLAPGPQEVLQLLESGARFSSVNVGGLHYTAGRVQLGKAIFLSEDDKDALRRIGRRGVIVEGRALPGDRAVDLLDLIGSSGEAG